MAETLQLDALKSEVARVANRYDAAGAYLFGSYARGDARPDSDVDVLIVGGPSFYPGNVFAIAEELHRSLGRPVDVYEESEINPGTAFFDSVMRDRVIAA